MGFVLTGRGRLQYTVQDPRSIEGGGCDDLAVLLRLSACDMAVCITSYMCLTSQLHSVRDFFVGMHELPFMYCSALGRASGTGTGRVEGGREGQLQIGPRGLWGT